MNLSPPAVMCVAVGSGRSSTRAELPPAVPPSKGTGADLGPGEVVKSRRKGSREQRLHLLLFTPAFFEQGGIARRSRLLTNGLIERGWRVSVVTRTSSRWRLRLTRGASLVVLEVPGYLLSRTGTLLYLTFALPVGVVWGQRATVLASVKLFSTSSAAAVCAQLIHRPFVALATTSGPAGEVAHLMGDHAAVSRKRCPGKIHRLSLGLRRALLRRAAVLVAQTPAGAEELQRLVPGGKVAVLPSPVEPVEAPGLTGLPKALFVGRLSRDKNILSLLEAWKLVVLESPGATLTFVGEGGSHDSVEDDLRRTVGTTTVLRRSVRFTGWVGDVAPFFAESDVFILPSLHLQEGMSNALVEACAWGRVIVASDIPANRAVLGEDYPLLVPPGDAAPLATAILRALRDDELRDEVRERVLERQSAFDVTTVCAHLEEVLKLARRQTTAPIPES